MWARSVFAHLLRIVFTLLLGGFLGATLVRMSPGFGVDERELDTRLSEEGIQALRESHSSESNILHFYKEYFTGLIRGELGYSQSLGIPVKELFRERLPVTLKSLGIGFLLGWAVGLGLALVTTTLNLPVINVSAVVVTGAFLCFPAAGVALLFLLIQGPVPLGIAFVLLPRVFRYAKNLLLDAYAQPHIVTAKARGLSELRILVCHVVPIAIPQILALAGVMVALGFGAAVPMEVICDSPGIGQLAWQAALSRDLSLMVNLTLLVTLVTLASNLVADLATARWKVEAL